MSDTRILVLSGLLVWAGATLLLAGWSRLARPDLAERLRPFHPGSEVATPSRPSLSLESFREVATPLVEDAAGRLASLLGVTEPVSTRLARIHSHQPASVFRLRQAGWSALALVVAAVLAAAVSAPPAAALLLIAGGPFLAFLVVEHHLARRSEAWQRRVVLELPVVAEQLAMLLNAGYSLGAALSRLADRGRGCVASDLQRVVNRVRQGAPEPEALQEWAEVARVPAVDRLVAVLTLHRGVPDLGRLVSAEAKQSRRDVQRQTIEAIERRAQQVWVPVTVATLVPGAVLLAVPFLAALRLFANS